MLREKEARGSSMSSWKRAWLWLAACTSVTLPQRFTVHAFNVVLELLDLHEYDVIWLVHASL